MAPGNQMSCSLSPRQSMPPNTERIRYETVICTVCGHVAIGLGSTVESAEADADNAFHNHALEHHFGNIED